MNLKLFGFLTLLLFGTAAACLPLNLSNLNGTNYSGSLDTCYLIVDDGSNLSFVFNAPNSTPPHQAHLNLSFTPTNATQLYQNTSEDLNITIGAAPPAPPFANVAINLNSTHKSENASGPGYFFFANFSSPVFPPTTTTLTPGGFVNILNPETSVLLSTVSCQQQSICSFSKNYTWNWSDQSYSNTTSPCNISISVGAVPSTLCYANASANYTTPGVYFDPPRNTSVVCSPQTATCPVLPSGQFNATPGQTLSFATGPNGTLAVFCPMQTQTITQIVPWNENYSNISPGTKTINVPVPVSYLATHPDIASAANGEIESLVAQQAAQYKAQFDVANNATQQCYSTLQSQLYGPFGCFANYSAQYTAFYGQGGNQSAPNITDGIYGPALSQARQNNGILALAIGFCILLIMLIGLAFVVNKIKSGPNRMAVSPLSANAGPGIKSIVDKHFQKP